MTVLERLMSKEYDLVTFHMPGLQPLTLEVGEIEEVKDGFIYLKESEMENENGKFTLQSHIQISSINTIDFVTKSLIVSGPKKKKLILN